MLRITLCQEHVAVVALGCRNVLLDTLLLRLLKFSKLLLSVARPLQSLEYIRQLEACLGGIGSQRKRLFEMWQRLFRLPLVREYESQIVLDAVFGRMRLDSTLQLFFRVGVAGHSTIHATEEIMSL